MFSIFWKTHGEKIISIIKGAALAASGAGATYLLSTVGNMDFGENSVYVAAGISVAVNILRKFGVAVLIK
mgnify:CR=1 FL=1